MRRVRNGAGFPLSAAVALALLVPSCAYFKELIGVAPRRPVVKVQEIEIQSASLSAAHLQVGLQVDNPNGFALNLSRLRYAVSALDMVLAEGAYDEPVSIPAEGRVRVRLPITINAENTLLLARKFLQTSQELAVLLQATAIFDTPVGDMEVSFEDSKAIKGDLLRR